MKLDLEGDNVFQIDMTVEQVRELSNTGNDALDTALDEAQAPVFGGEAVAYLVIKITK